MVSCSIFHRITRPTSQACDSGYLLLSYSYELVIDSMCVYREMDRIDRIGSIEN